MDDHLRLHIVHRAPDAGCVGEGVCPDPHATRQSCGAGRAACDIATRERPSRLLDDVKPEVIVHLAALTDVDLCEREPAQAEALHVGATKTLADWILSGQRLCPPDLYSTDQVYDAPGRASRTELRLATSMP